MRTRTPFGSNPLAPTPWGQDPDLVPPAPQGPTAWDPTPMPTAATTSPFGADTPNLFNKRNSPGKKDNWSLGDAANSTGDLASWLFGQGGNLTGGAYDMFSKLLGGQFPDALEGHYPTRFAGELAQGQGTLADAWGERAGAIRKNFLDTSLGAAWDTQQKIRDDYTLDDAMAEAQGVLGPALARGRDMIHDQGAANQANAARQIDEEMSGGMRAKMAADSLDKRVGTEAQAIQKMTSDLTQSTLLPTLQSYQQISQQGMQQSMQQALQQALGQGMAMEAAGQNNINSMGPNVLSALMTSVYPGYDMAGLNAAMQVPSQLSQFLTGLANMRVAGRQTGGSDGGFLSGLMGMMPKMSFSS